MTQNLAPDQCLLCGTSSSVRRAEFQQIYGQRQSTPQHLSWWECGSCRGWFVFPAPTPDAIAGCWFTVVWNDPNRQEEIGPKRDAKLSRMLQGQFHSISIANLASILRRVGFDGVGVEPQAAPAPASRLPVLTKTAYRLARVVSLATLSKVNVSPGVLLFAQKGA